MRIRFILIQGTPELETARLQSYIERKFGLPAVFETRIVTDTPVINHGLSPAFPMAESMDAVPLFTKYGTGTDWLICCWKPAGESIATTGYEPVSDTIITSAPFSDADNLYRELSHEDYHGFWGYLSLKKGVVSRDTMDVRLSDENYSHEHDIENPDGNRERNLAALQPYLHILRDRYSTVVEKPSAKTLSMFQELLLRFQKLRDTINGKLAPTPAGYAALVETFGNPLANDFEQKNIVTFDFPYPLYYAGQKVTTGRCHRLAVPNFQGALREIQNNNLSKYVQNYGGIYNKRLQRTGNVLSTHAFGIAIDIEPQKYPLGGSLELPKAVTDIFAKYGFICGSTFPTKDSGHFQLCRDY